jgi:hypothetical protein
VHYLAVSTVTNNDAFGLLVWNGIASMVILFAVLRLVRSPRELFSYGLVSKTAWVITIVWLSWHSGPALVPIGAFASFWHLHRLARNRDGGAPGYPPFAAGRPVDEQ